ncbi:unnamed protein product [Taenia asiatica]|uniref:START domain-containing protein n=1 Tax=Taenia asiatica TaxID=60517 RepID=A0A0R3W984_TAEAS|nr:unnamed protein product [Taenia asiatica]
MPNGVGEVIVPKKSDFDCFVELATDSLGWMKHYSSKSKYLSIRAYTKIVEGNVVRAAKIEGVFHGVSAFNVYESLQDPEFRKTWDDCMKEGSRICYLVKSPFGLKDRDFVNQRSWYADGSVYIIMNHSVKMPPVEGVQRGISYVTGYLIKPLTPDSCDFTYISHSDPRGKLHCKSPLRNSLPKGKVPSWVVNASVKTVGPIIVKRLYEAACTYAAWKAVHDPDHKPWSNFHQMQESPPLDPADVGMLNTKALSIGNDDDSEEEVPDESSLVPTNSDSGQSLNGVDNSSPIRGLNTT